jgi:hypothetical protein
MTNTLKPYVELDCDSVETISANIHKFLQNETTLLASGAIGWQFVDCKKLLKSNFELLSFFKKYKLVPKDAAVVILTETGQLPLHVDELPVVAKINIPVINTDGWVTQWYSVSDEDLNSCPTAINQFGKTIENLQKLPNTAFTLLSELHNQDKIVAFNSRIPHAVIKTTATVVPRIIASFTFYNEPLDLLK